MDNLIEVLVPTFTSSYLFWIISRKDVLLRTAIHRTLSSNRPKPVDSGLCLQMEVAVNVDGVWARGIIENITDSSVKRVLCWLPDYGVKIVANQVFRLPSDLKRCPHLAKQASLLNVVNLMTELKLGNNGYEVGYSKTTNCIDGVNKFALNCIEEAEEIYFQMLDENSSSLYGDLILVKNGKKKSLTNLLIEQQLLAEDKEMFNSMEPTRILLKESFFESNSPKCALKLVEKINLPKILFNTTKNQALSNLEIF